MLKGPKRCPQVPMYPNVPLQKKPNKFRCMSTYHDTLPMTVTISAHSIIANPLMTLSRKYTSLFFRAGARLVLGGDHLYIFHRIAIARDLVHMRLALI